jgi:hypothetical protein
MSGVHRLIFIRKFICAIHLFILYVYLSRPIYLWVQLTYFHVANFSAPSCIPGSFPCVAQNKLQILCVQRFLMMVMSNKVFRNSRNRSCKNKLCIIE